MAQPTLSWSLNWGNNKAEKLSGKTFVNPSGQSVNCAEVEVSFQSSVDFKKFYATAVKDGLDYGFIDDVLVDIEGAHPTGILIHELTNRAGHTNFTFKIKVNSHLLSGEGLYRIGLYVQQTDGTWNYEYFFVPVGDDYFDLKVQGDHLQVPVITN